MLFRSGADFFRRRCSGTRAGHRREEEAEIDEPQPYVEGQPTIFEPNLAGQGEASSVAQTR